MSVAIRSICQMGPQRVAAVARDDGEVRDATCLRPDDAEMGGEGGLISVEHGDARSVGTVEVTEEDVQERPLDLVQPGVSPARPIDLVLPPPSVLPKAPHGGGEIRIVREDGTTIPEGTEVLRRVEGERRDVAEGACDAAAAAQAVSLGAILEDRDVREPGRVHRRAQRRNVDQPAIEVRRDDRERALAERGNGRGDREEMAIGFDVREDGRKAGGPRRGRRVSARIRDRHDFRPSRHAGRLGRAARVRARPCRWRARCNARRRCTRRTPRRKHPFAGH